MDECTAPQDVYDGLRVRLEAERPAITSSELAVVLEVTLEGVLAFDRGRIF